MTYATDTFPQYIPVRKILVFTVKVVHESFIKQAFQYQGNTVNVSVWDTDCTLFVGSTLFLFPTHSLTFTFPSPSHLPFHLLLPPSPFRLFRSQRPSSSFDPQTDVYILCFSIGDRESYKNIYQKWIPEICKPGIESTMILVGTKIDLRGEISSEDKKERKNNESKKEAEKKSQPSTEMADEGLLKKSHGQKLSVEIQAFRYVEISAMKNIGVNELFLEATLAVTIGNRQPRQEKSPRCVMM